MASGCIVKLKIELDGSLAMIEEILPENEFGVPVSADDIISALSLEKVTEGVDYQLIKDAVASVLDSGQRAENIRAASVNLKHSFCLAGVAGSATAEQLVEVVENARKCYLYLNQKEFNDHKPTQWVSPNTIIYQIRKADKKDIFGRKNIQPSVPLNLKAGDYIVNDSQVDGFRLISEVDGFMTVDDNDAFQIISPFFVSEDKMEVTVRLLKLANEDQVDQLINHLSSYYSDYVIQECRVLTLPELLEKVRAFYAGDECFTSIVIAAGRPPVEGTPGKVEFQVNLQGRPDIDEDEKVNFADFSSYCMVQKQDLLVKVILPVQGTQGLTVTGDVIECEYIEAPELNVEDQIDIIDHEEERLLTAADNGCLIYCDNKISVSDTIVIDGNVGPESGNIKKGASSVIVKGNVLGGFSVEADDNIIVEGSIENGAFIRCKNLTVYKGVFGLKSDIYVTGSAEIGYIQGASMRILGNLTVLKYIMEAEISCRGQLYVHGHGVSSRDRGALIGGNLSILQSVYLHSIGSVSEPTRLICGLDTHLYNKLILCKNAIAAIQTEITRIQSSIGFDLAGLEAIDRVRSMTPEKRAQVGQKLEVIKGLLAKVDQYQQQCDKVESKAIAKDISALRIKVERHVIPRVSVTIGDAQLDITSKLSGVSLRYYNKEVIVGAI